MAPRSDQNSYTHCVVQREISPQGVVRYNLLMDARTLPPNKLHSASLALQTAVLGIQLWLLIRVSSSAGTNVLGKQDVRIIPNARISTNKSETGSDLRFGTNQGLAELVPQISWTLISGALIIIHGGLPEHFGAPIFTDAIYVTAVLDTGM